MSDADSGNRNQQAENGVWKHPPFGVEPTFECTLGLQRRAPILLGCEVVNLFGHAVRIPAFAAPSSKFRRENQSRNFPETGSRKRLKR